MGEYLDLFVKALISATAAAIVEVGIKRRLKDGGLPWQGLLRSSWLRWLLYLFLAVLISAFTWRVVYPSYEQSLYTFDQSAEGWVALPDPADAAVDAQRDTSTPVLRAAYDFNLTAPGDPNPRATFYRDNLNASWADYQTLGLDVFNPGPHNLELSYSVGLFEEDGQYCFYEYSQYLSLPPSEWTTVRFNLHDPQFKSCHSPDVPDQPLNLARPVNRLFLIVGTDDRPADFQGVLLIDNIQLRQDVTWVPYYQAALVLILIGAFIYLDWRRTGRLGKRPLFVGTGDPDAGRDI